jgi:hypothetical protein
MADTRSICDVCGKEFKARKGLATHIGSKACLEKGKIYKCEKCWKIFTVEKDYVRHAQKKISCEKLSNLIKNLNPEPTFEEERHIAKLVCKNTEEYLHIIKHTIPPKWDNDQINNNMLRYGAMCGNADVCIKAKANGATCWNKMAYCAILCESTEIQELAIEWGALNWDNMILFAARIGNKEICESVRKYATASGDDIDYNNMLKEASLNNYTELCILAREWGADNLDGMITYAGYGGHENICTLAINWGKLDSISIDYNELLVAGARCGHKHICILAKELGAYDLYEMISKSLYAGYIEICDLAIQWAKDSEVVIDWNSLLRDSATWGYIKKCIFTEKHGATNYDGMLANGAFGGHKHICEIAKERGAKDFNRMLYMATCNDNEEMCVLAKKYGATNFAEMLHTAAYHSSEHLCKLAKEWYDSPASIGTEGIGYETKMDFNKMLHEATRGNNLNLCKLAKKWGASNFEEMLITATICERPDLCAQAKQWGAKKFDDMLSNSAFCDNKKLCKLAKKWGARDFNAMLIGAVCGGNIGLSTLATKWGATNACEAQQDSIHSSIKDIYELTTRVAKTRPYGSQEELCELARKWGATE